MQKDLEKLLDILACPECKGELKLKENWFICYKCRLKYPIKENIPILLVEEAHSLENNER